MKRKWLLLLLLGLDFASKIGAISLIPPLRGGAYPFGGIAIFSSSWITFSLNYIVNTGAAWGLFPGHSGLLFALRVAIIFCLLAYLLFFQRGQTPKFSLWLVATGAVGNALDYALYGHVIDFFHFTFWNRSFPIFNLADSYITLGVAGLLVLERKAQKQIAL